MLDRTIIMAALNGARRTRADHPNLPLGAAEIAAECARCMVAGAAAVHVHTRTESGEHVLDAGRSRELLQEIEVATGGDIIIQTTTEAVGRYSPAEIAAFVRELEPEAVSIALRDLIPSPEHEAEAGKLLAWLREAGVWTQLIAYSPEDVARVVALRKSRIIPFGRPYLLFVLGRYTPGQFSTPDDLAPFLGSLEDIHSAWSFCAFGAREHDCAIKAIDLGGDIRVGFENNLLLPDGTQAEYSSDLVRLAADYAAKAGRPAMTSLDVTELIAAGAFS